MAKAESMSLAYIDKKPVAAGRLLAAMDAADAAAFLDAVPEPYVTRALAHIGAWSASAIVSEASSRVSEAALRGLPYSDAAAILRLMAQDVRESALNALPAGLQRDFRMSLSYPDDTVGAQMTTSIMIQRPYHTVADARAEMRRATDADVPVVFVVDDSHQVAGVVSADTLLRQPGKSPLHDVMDTGIEALPARARIATVFDVAAWDEYTYLPVANRTHAVIGALARKSVGRQRKDSVAPAPSGKTALVGALFSALVATTTGLMGLATRAVGTTSDLSHSAGNRHDIQKPESQ